MLCRLISLVPEHRANVLWATTTNKSIALSTRPTVTICPNATTRTQQSVGIVRATCRSPCLSTSLIARVPVAPAASGWVTQQTAATISAVDSSRDTPPATQHREDNALLLPLRTQRPLLRLYVWCPPVHKVWMTVQLPTRLYDYLLLHELLLFRTLLLILPITSTVLGIFHTHHQQNLPILNLRQLLLR